MLRERGGELELLQAHTHTNGVHTRKEAEIFFFFFTTYKMIKEVYNQKGEYNINRVCTTVNVKPLVSELAR